MEREREELPLVAFKGERPTVSCQPVLCLRTLFSLPSLKRVQKHTIQTRIPSLPWVSLVQAMVQSCSLALSPLKSYL